MGGLVARLETIDLVSVVHIFLWKTCVDSDELPTNSAMSSFM